MHPTTIDRLNRWRNLDRAEFSISLIGMITGEPLPLSEIYSRCALFCRLYEAAHIHGIWVTDEARRVIPEESA